MPAAAPKPSAVVRRATLDDAPALAALRWQWRVEEKGERAADPNVFARKLRSWWSERADHLAFLAEVQTDPAGMAWLAVIDRVHGPEAFVRRAGMLQSVYVRPEHRGHGTGAALVAAVTQKAHGLGLGYLIVHPSVPSYSLYRRAGFVETPKVLELGLHERG